LRNTHSTAAVVIAAPHATDNQLLGCSGRVVTVMGRLAQAAGVNRGGGRRQREREEIPDKSEQQQKSCYVALHASFVNQNPEVNSA